MFYFDLPVSQSNTKNQYNALYDLFRRRKNCCDKFLSYNINVLKKCEKNLFYIRWWFFRYKCLDHHRTSLRTVFPNKIIHSSPYTPRVLVSTFRVLVSLNAERPPKCEIALTDFFDSCNTTNPRKRSSLNFVQKKKKLT